MRNANGERKQLTRAKGIVLALVAVSGVVLFAGCAGTVRTTQVPVPSTMTAQYTGTPVKVDGRLDEAVWKRAAAYPLAFDRGAINKGAVLTEPGEVRLAWDEEYLYLAVKFYDSDITAEGEEDQLHHYKMGDLAELFLKPDKNTWYWELYVTPTSKKSSFWYPGRGRLGLESCERYTCGLRVAAQCEGTLNNWRDTDSYWTAEMAMPVKDLTARGDAFGPGAQWRILVGRYNFSRYLLKKELSAVPSMSKDWFHFYEEYSRLELVKWIKGET